MSQENPISEQTELTDSEQSAVATLEPTTNPPVDPQINKQIAASESADATDAIVEEKKATGFSALSLNSAVQSTIAKLGYETPSPIQAEMIPHMLDGRDVIGQAQTGTGKTAAFALPILSQIDVQCKTPQVLVLAPTRELAIQVASSFEKYARNTNGFRVAAIYGGQDYEIQLRQIRRGVQVIVGTPGRTIDHIKRKTLNVSEIKCLVLDEADEMLNMGFVDDVQWVLEQTPEGRQVALFSATMPPAIRNIAQRYLHDPVEIKIKDKTSTVKAIRQRCLIVNGRDKLDALIRILESETTDGVMVFAKTRGSTVQVAEELAQRGYRAAALNGDLAQRQRERTVDQLKAGRLDVIVATDVAARGLDVQRISHVFNYDMPHDSEAYVHRIGRTGRAGRSGEAILFVSRAERGKLRMIERATNQPIEIMNLPSIDAVNQKRIANFKQQITDRIDTPETPFFQKLITDFLAETDQPIEKIAAALAQMAQGTEPLLIKERPKRKRESRDRDRNSGRGGRNNREDGYGSRRESRGRDSDSRSPKRTFTPPEAGMERFRIQVGHKQSVRPGNIVGAIANEGGIDSSSIGRIYIYDTYSTVDLPAGMPGDVLQTLQRTWVAGNKLMIARDGEQASTGKEYDRKPRTRTSEGSSRTRKPASGSSSTRTTAPRTSSTRNTSTRSSSTRTKSKDSFSKSRKTPGATGAKSKSAKSGSKKAKVSPSIKSKTGEPKRRFKKLRKMK